MQELISKEAVLEALSDMSRGYSIAREEIKALPTTVHHEYKVGDTYEFLHVDGDWIVSELKGFWATTNSHYSEIRPLSEHPDITQARELLEKSGYSVTKI